MPLTLVLGPANSAKAGEMLGAFAAAAPRGALLVVPTRPDARHYTRELAEQGVVLGRVLTFSGLAAEVARRAGYVGRPISNVARERVLVAVLREQRLDVLAESARSAGFLAAAGNLIAELERSLITPQRLTQALRKWAADDGHRARYADEVSAIYRGYFRRLDRLGRVDRELYAWRALDALRDSPGRWGAEEVFFYGFDDLHPLERDAVETLSEIVGTRVTVSLTYEAGRPALKARAEVVEALRPLARRVIELPALEDHYDAGSRRALHHVERWLFAGPPERVDPGSAVRLLEAGGERAEAELVGAEVLSLLRSGVPGDQIAVVCRSLARSADVLQSVFTQYGIPVAAQRNVPFGHTALGRAVLTLGRCALLPAQATADDVLTYLRTPGLLERLEVADRLERDVRREALRSAEQAMERLGFDLDEVDVVRKARNPGEELARQARRLMAAPARHRALVLEEAGELDARALRSLLAAVTELEALGLAPTGAELLGLLEQLPVEASSQIRPGAVQVCEPLAIRARRFAAVFVCGLQESEFPRASTPEPFFSDERRRELTTASGLPLRPTEETLPRERYLFYSAVSRATHQVVLSWRSSDEEGNLALPSPFIDDVAELLVEGWRDRRRRRLLGDVVWRPEEAPTERELRHALAARGALYGGSRARAYALSEVALRHARHRRIVSSGALESYGDCPMKWLVERELSPERFDAQPEPLARGAYMHRVLEEVIGRLGSSVSPRSLADAERILEEVLEEMPPAIAPGRPPSIRAGIRAGIEADLRRYLRHEAADGVGWEPYGLELKFGFEEEEGALAPLVLGDESEPVLVRGLIDRVDVDPAGTGRAIVRDYKSGPVRPEYQGARWRADRRLQVALYMLAIRRIIGLEPVAGLYQPIGGSELRARGIFRKEEGVGDRLVANDGREPVEFDSELDDAAARSVELALRLRAGSVEPCPQTCSRDGCAYPGICRSEM